MENIYHHILLLLFHNFQPKQSHFSMNLSLGQEKAPIELTASAEVDGKTVATTRTVILN